jgi:hypothetical protein
MKVIKLAIMLFATGLFLQVPAEAQTTGTLTFSFTTASSGGYSPKHLVAVWIENSSNTFVKTKLKRSSNSNLSHLNLWTAKSQQNIVDATTGATITTHGNITINWNGTNVAGTQVPDGNYTLWVEMAWSDNMMTGKTAQSFTFTKGTGIVHLTPAPSTNLSNITLDWIPGSTSSDEIPVESAVKVYPNPTTGQINIALPEQVADTRVMVLNSLGTIVIDEKFQQAGASVKSIDLSKLSKGMYFVQLIQAGNKQIFKVMLN